MAGAAGRVLARVLLDPRGTSGPTPSRTAPWVLSFVLVLTAACSASGGEDAAPRATASTGASAGPPTTAEPAPIDLAADALPTVGTPPDEYSVVFRVERRRGNGLDVVTEERVARPPFLTRVDARPGEPEQSGEPDRVDLEVFGGLELGPLDQNRVIVVLEPRPASRGGRFTTDFGAAVEAGVVEPRGLAREILGRRCVEVRTGDPVDAGFVVAPTEEDHVDLCVDERGLVLREEVTVSGRVTSRRTAVAVDATPALGDDVFDPLGWRIPQEEGGGRVRRITDDSRPPGVDHHQLPAPPRGFDHVGRYGVATDTASGPNAAGAVDRRVSVVDVYRSGTDAVVVENGELVSGASAFGPGVLEVDSDRFDDASALFLPTGVELRVSFDDGRFLRLVGTLGVDRLVTLLDSVETVTGDGEVVPFDDQTDVTGRLESPEPDHAHDGHSHDGTAPGHVHDDDVADDHAHDRDPD